jgi:hypothetical protein
MPLVGAEKLLAQARLNVKVISGPGTPTSLVSSEAPGLGALVNVGSMVDLSTTAGTGVAGINKLTLVNNTQRSVAVWSFDTATGQYTQQNGSSELAESAQTEMTLDSGHVYLVYALDPSQCGGQNDPNDSQCWIWEGGFVGSSAGSGTCSMGSPQCWDCRLAARPGSEAALRRLIAGILVGQPNYAEMTPDLAAVTRQQLPKLEALVQGFGAVQSVQFQGVGQAGWDSYEVKQQHGSTLWRLSLDSSGIIDGALVTLAPWLS